MSNESAQDFYANYAEYNKGLRTWFVSFGLGALVLFMLHPEFVTLLKKTGHFQNVVFLFLFGCLLQIFISLMNKYSSWHMYFAAQNNISPNAFWHWLNNAFWIDEILDLATLTAFGWAILIMVQTFVLQ